MEKKKKHISLWCFWKKNVRTPNSKLQQQEVYYHENGIMANTFLYHYSDYFFHHFHKTILSCHHYQSFQKYFYLIQVSRSSLQKQLAEFPSPCKYLYKKSWPNKSFKIISKILNAASYLNLLGNFFLPNRATVIKTSPNLVGLHNVTPKFVRIKLILMQIKT